jgi:uncharacterized protein (TIGR02266 family)
MSMQEKSREEALPSPPEEAVARAISLIYPITQTEGPIRRVSLKKRPSTRRQPPVSSTAGPRRQPKLCARLGDVTCTNFFTGLERDISSGGLFVATFDIYPVGTVVNVEVDMPGGLVLMGKAKVAWVREHCDAITDLSPGMGVVFKRLTPRAKREINRYIAEHDSLYYEAV